MPPLGRLGEGKKLHSLNRQTQQGLNHTKIQAIQRSASLRSLYVQWCRKTAHQLNPINFVSWSAGTDFRPTYSTTPSEEAGRDHSFLGLLSNSNTPTASFNLQMCPRTFALTAIPESNGNIILCTVQEKHLFCLLESNFKSPVNVTGVDDSVEKKPPNCFHSLSSWLVPLETRWSLPLLCHDSTQPQSTMHQLICKTASIHSVFMAFSPLSF